MAGLPDPRVRGSPRSSRRPSPRASPRSSRRPSPRFSPSPSPFPSGGPSPRPSPAPSMRRSIRGSFRGSRSRPRGPTPRELRAALIEPMEEARFAANVLREGGATAAHARLVASALAAADVRGKYRFGLLTLPSLLNAISRGTVDPRRSPSLVDDAATLAWVDGRDAFGPVIGHFCMNLALHKARKHGLGVVFCHSITDLGFPGWYSSMALKKNMIGLCFSSVHEKPISASEAAAGDTKLGLNRLSACAPCVEANNFELQMSWRLELPPQTMKPRLPAELRRATSSDLVLTEDPRPPPGACGHDPRKGFLAALMVEGLCGFLGGMHYKGPPRAAEEQPFYLSFPLMADNEDSRHGSEEGSRESANKMDNADEESLKSKQDSARISQESSNVEIGSDQRNSADTLEGKRSPPVAEADSSASDEGPTEPKSNLREIDCSRPPPPDVKAIDECACAEGAPKKVPPPGEQAVVCVPPGKVPSPKAEPRTSKLRPVAPINTIPEEEASQSDTDEFGIPLRNVDRSPSKKSADEDGSEDSPKRSVEDKGARYPKKQSSGGEALLDQEEIEGPEAAHCFIVIDPDAVQSGFSKRLGAFLRSMISQEPLDPARPVLIPGDPERMCILRAQRQGGVRFLTEDVRRLNLLAERMGVEPVRFNPDVEYAWWKSDV